MHAHTQYNHQQFALHGQTLQARPPMEELHTKPQSAAPKSLAPGSLERRTVLWVCGDNSRSIIPGDSNCWRKPRWGICDCAVGYSSGAQPVLRHATLVVVVSQMWYPFTAIEIEAALSSDDTQLLAAGASVWPHRRNPE